MDFGHIDATVPIAVLSALTLAIAVDWILGAISAAQGGTFKWEYLYAVALTKGAALFRIAVLLLAGAVSPFFRFDLLGIDADPFTVLGMALAVPLAASTLASIVDNAGKRDLTAPQGVAPVATVTPADKV